MKALPDVLLDIDREKHFAVLTINRPQKRNAIRMETLDSLHRALTICEDDGDIRCLILTGSGDIAMSAGGDLNSELLYATEEKEGLQRFESYGIELIQRIMLSPLPIISAVNGMAIGGILCIVAASDFVFTADHAVFGLPTLSLGGMPGWGCMRLLADSLGPHWAKRLLLANERLDAQQALSLGLVEQIIPFGALMNTAKTLASRVAGYPPNTVGLMKRIIHDSVRLPFEEAMRLETSHFVHENWQNKNFAEGIHAFMEKREPRFNFEESEACKG